MYQISNVKIPGGALISFECDTEEEVFRRMNFFQQMPHVCPIDGAETIYFYRKDDEGNSYCSIVSAVHPQYSFKFGKRRGVEKELFPKGWYEYDSAAKCNWYWRDGQWFAVDEDGKPLWDKPRPGSKRVVTSPADIDRVLDEAAQGEVSQNGPHVQEDMAHRVAYKIFDDLGQSLYNQQWTGIAKRNAGRASNGRTEDPRSLTLEELNKLSEGLRKVMQEKQLQPA